MTKSQCLHCYIHCFPHISIITRNNNYLKDIRIFTFKRIHLPWRAYVVFKEI